ncbi:MAG: hypothetical protein K9L30_09295 [Desulfobacterales bacterium]|nr:hypothetical protein [Desulfobacterales bacterium]
MAAKNPEMHAWLTAFYIENHLDYYTYPSQVATPEQVRFMVSLGEYERYYPCSDLMFDEIMKKGGSEYLKKQYKVVLDKILALIEKKIEKFDEKKYLSELIRIKHKHETRDGLMIPSRLEKRLLKIFINRTQIEDPHLYEKATRNWRASQALNSQAFRDAFNHLEPSDFLNASANISGIRKLVGVLELKRLFSLCHERSLWETDVAETFTKANYYTLFERDITGNGLEPLLETFGIVESNNSIKNGNKKKILWLANEAGEIMVDFMIIRYLANLGHKIIIAFKDGPFYTKVDFYDAQTDDALTEALEDALIIKENNLSKNDLIKMLRHYNSTIAINDGTRETINLLLATKTFSRVFKEVDCVISRGVEQKHRFFDTHFQFTQDIYNISEGENNTVEIAYKPKDPKVIKFSHKNLEDKANLIIKEMKDARNNGMSVTFYSGIIGSIPGKIKIAKKIMSVFIQHLKKQFDEAYIINPSEYYEPGMDADDLMYMWEIVQRSGYIDIWRFQSYEDIVESFQLMGEKVPPEWVGKDATFSTGCTKEIKIAVEVQELHPEMQISGPSVEKFMRRNEYGIGKMFDKKLIQIHSQIK